jgi:hypothetical protein
MAKYLSKFQHLSSCYIIRKALITMPYTIASSPRHNTQLPRFSSDSPSQALQRYTQNNQTIKKATDNEVEDVLRLRGDRTPKLTEVIELFNNHTDAFLPDAPPPNQKNTTLKPPAPFGSIEIDSFSVRGGLKTLLHGGGTVYYATPYKNKEQLEEGLRKLQAGSFEDNDRIKRTTDVNRRTGEFQETVIEHFTGADRLERITETRSKAVHRQQYDDYMVLTQKTQKMSRKELLLTVLGDIVRIPSLFFTK